MEDKKKDTIPVYERTGDINDKQNGNLFANINGYSIYQFGNVNAYNYYLAIPNEYNSTYQLFIGFPQKEFKYTKKEDIIKEIDDIKKMVSAMNKDGIYVLPDIPLEKLKDAAKENDNKKFSQLLNNTIQPIISDIYLRIKSYDNASRTVDQLIYFVKQSESDTKFVQWLEINLPNFVKGISYNEIKKYYYANLNDDKEKNMDLDKTMVISREQLFENTVKADEQQQSLNKSKKRVLVRPDTNRYGFGNIPLLIIILTTVSILGIIIFNMLLK